MKTKEAIKAVGSCKSMHADDLPYGEDAAYDYLKRKNVVLDKVIECLQRGDKFEKMCGEFKRVKGCAIAVYPTYKDRGKPTIEEDMDIIKQKYFPKK